MVYDRIVRIVLLSPPAVLLALAIPGLLSGLKLDRVFPTPLQIAARIAEPKGAYESTADTLRGSASGDGLTTILRGRALALAAHPPAEFMPVLEQGLEKAPASIGGWTSLAAAEAMIDRHRAAQMLSMALLLGPYDYWSAEARAAMAIELWPDLDRETQDAVLRQVRLFWQDRYLHRQLRTFLQLPGGAEMVTRAFATDPDTLRALNRWIAAARRQSAVASQSSESKHAPGGD